MDAARLEAVHPTRDLQFVWQIEDRAAIVGR